MHTRLHAPKRAHASSPALPACQQLARMHTYGEGRGEGEGEEGVEERENRFTHIRLRKMHWVAIGTPNKGEQVSRPDGQVLIPQLRGPGNGRPERLVTR